MNFTAINPHASQRTFLVALGSGLWHKSQIIWQWTWHDVVGRSKGSAMEPGWILASVVPWAGCAWFQWARKGCSDVI